MKPPILRLQVQEGLADFGRQQCNIQRHLSYQKQAIRKVEMTIYHIFFSLLIYHAAFRHQARDRVFSRSIPLNRRVNSSASIRSAVAVGTPSSFGQLNRPFAKRLVSNQVPDPSQ